LRLPTGLRVLLLIPVLPQTNLDVQSTEGLTFPTPNVFYSTPGTAPTINDSVTPPQRDEPYLWLDFVISKSDITPILPCG